MIGAMKLLEKITRDIRHRFAQLQNDERGVSAVEFALLLPLMLTLYLGCVEISQAISADRKVTLTSRTVADLVSQLSTIDKNGVTDVLKASSSVMAPFKTTTLKVTVTSVKIDSAGNATVAWSESLDGTVVHAPGDTVTLPTALKIANSTVIWAESSHDYTPAIGYIITGPLTLNDKLYMAPRLASCVTYPPTVTTCP
jgi:Flp pilus assembly protein TadG